MLSFLRFGLLYLILPACALLLVYSADLLLEILPACAWFSLLISTALRVSPASGLRADPVRRAGAVW